MFKNIEETIKWIENSKNKEYRKNLDKLIYVSKLLGNPEGHFKKVHIAGTNGKGSTACFLRSILVNKGLKVGFYTSPFIISFNERIQINYDFISDSDLIKYANILYDLQCTALLNENYTLSFFEIMTFIAMLYFKDNKIDIAIIECGLGGLLDATNYCRYDLAIITSIGYDHMKTLGNTLEDIALQKLGIVKNGMMLITGVDRALVDFFYKYINKINASVCFIDSSNSIPEINDECTVFSYKGVIYRLNMLGVFQVSNSILAIEAASYLYKDITYEDIYNGLADSKWPGRMEIVSKNPLIILDGAHNISAFESLVSTLNIIRKNRRLVFIYTSLKDKDYSKVLNYLDKYADEFIFTEINDSRAEKADAFTKDVTKESSIIKEPADAMEFIFKNKDSYSDTIIVICGSLHFISYVRNNIKRLDLKVF